MRYGCGHGDRDDDDDDDDDGMAGVVELGAGCGDDGMVAVAKWNGDYCEAHFSGPNRWA